MARRDPFTQALSNMMLQTFPFHPTVEKKQRKSLIEDKKSTKKIEKKSSSMNLASSSSDEDDEDEDGEGDESDSSSVLGKYKYFFIQILSQFLSKVFFVQIGNTGGL